MLTTVPEKILKKEIVYLVFDSISALEMKSQALRLFKMRRY
jgi:hypothetical protein